MLGDANNTEDVFLRDLVNGPIYMMSTAVSGTAAANGRSFDPYLSRNGKYVVFTTEATDTSTLGDTNGKTDVVLQVAPNKPGDPLRPDNPPSPGPGSQARVLSR